MIHFIIDGNNLIGKLKITKTPHSLGKYSNRSGLVNLLNRYFAGKKMNMSLHFDGHFNSELHLSKGKIIYSEKHSSDNKIKIEIEKSKNPKLITLISSDRNLADYARLNSCKVIKSEKFVLEIQKIFEKNEEFEQVKILENEKELFIKLFTNN